MIEEELEGDSEEEKKEVQPAQADAGNSACDLLMTNYMKLQQQRRQQEVQ